jgi:hypothetical protein
MPDSIYTIMTTKSPGALYISIGEDDTPKGSIEKKFLISTQKRNLLLREKCQKNPT